jgi:hypothetical protein
VLLALLAMGSAGLSKFLSGWGTVLDCVEVTTASSDNPHTFLPWQAIWAFSTVLLMRAGSKKEHWFGF